MGPKLEIARNFIVEALGKGVLSGDWRLSSWSLNLPYGSTRRHVPPNYCVFVNIFSTCKYFSFLYHERPGPGSGFTTLFINLVSSSLQRPHGYFGLAEAR
jgi:hypothetical protein